MWFHFQLFVQQWSLSASCSQLLPPPHLHRVMTSLRRPNGWLCSWRKCLGSCAVGAGTNGRWFSVPRISPRPQMRWRDWPKKWPSSALTGASGPICCRCGPLLSAAISEETCMKYALLFCSKRSVNESPPSALSWRSSLPSKPPCWDGQTSVRRSQNRSVCAAALWKLKHSCFPGCKSYFVLFLCSFLISLICIISHCSPTRPPRCWCTTPRI